MNNFLTDRDFKHWGPNREMLDYVLSVVPDDATVLEIGPGHIPFPKAKTFVDLRPLGNLPGAFHQVDLDHNPLPFEDKSFDYVYCRHVLEDMINPFLLCREMQRVAHAGYIETPSPMAEICRGVDGGSPPWRGYFHHRYLVWNSNGELRFVAKLPVIEYLNQAGNQGVDEYKICFDLRHRPPFWNTYYFWNDTLPVRNLQWPQDFLILEQYPAVLARAIADSEASTKALLETIKLNRSAA